MSKPVAIPSHGLWSLWDLLMMKMEADQLFAAIAMMKTTNQFLLDFDRRDRLMKGDNPAMSKRGLDELAQHGAAVAAICERLAG
jgi:hypothetical protein